MTNKTTQIAMFAIAAFALGGVAFAPAYAASYASTSLTAGSGYTVSSTDYVSCGSEQCTAKVESHTTQNFIKYKIGTVGGNQCDVSILIVGADDPYSKSHGSISGQVEFLFNELVNQGDRITLTATYTNCT